MIQIKHLNFQYNSYNINLQASSDDVNWIVDICSDTGRTTISITKSDLADLIMFLKTIPLKNEYSLNYHGPAIQT